MEASLEGRSRAQEETCLKQPWSRDLCQVKHSRQIQDEVGIYNKN